MRRLRSDDPLAISLRAAIRAGDLQSLKRLADGPILTTRLLRHQRRPSDAGRSLHCQPRVGKTSGSCSCVAKKTSPSTRRLGHEGAGESPGEGANVPRHAGHVEAVR